MKKIFRIALAASVLSILSACNNDDKKDPPPTPTTLEIEGTVIKGTFAGALVEIFNASDLTTPIGSTQTDDVGHYTIIITNPAGDPFVGTYVVKISADEDSTMVCDALTCGEFNRGDLIPAHDLKGLSLSSIGYAEGVSEEITTINVNGLSTMATDAVLAQVAANPNLVSAIDTLPIEDVTTLQENASVVVGEILGVDLSESNIFEITIVDSTDTQDVADAVDAARTSASITNTLTLINASLAGLPISSGSTLGDTINNYLDDVAVVTTTVVEAIADEADIATALADPATVAAQLALAVVQIEISDQANTLQQEIESDANTAGIDVVIDIVEIPTIVPEIEIDLGDIVVVTVTGGTGNTGG